MSHNDAFPTATYSQLRRLRQALASPKDLDDRDYSLFSRSLLNREDVDLMCEAARRTEDGTTAGRIFLELFTMGRIGNLTGAMRYWLERPDDGSDALVFIGIVLKALAVDLADGAAMRALYDFSHHEAIGLNLERAVEKIGHIRVREILDMSPSEQISDRLRFWSDSPSAAGLWLLRVYADNPEVQQFWRSFLDVGALGALAGLFYAGDPLEWPAFDNVNYDSPPNRQMVLNLVIENVRRGGSLAELESSMFWSTLAGDERAELYQEIAVRSHDRARSKHTDTEGT